jgi:outer membrane immunogenic protein
MTKFSVAMVALLASTTCLSGAAFAADLPVKAPYREPPVINNWTGFYIGGHGGFGWGKFKDIDEADLVGTFTGDSFNEPKMRGFVAGVHGGFNWQVSNVFVLGVEGDYSFTGIKKNQSLSDGPAGTDITVGTIVCHNACVQTDNLNTKIDSLASIRGRLGFLVTPNFMLYGTGGGAFAHTKIDVHSSSVTGIPLISVGGPPVTLPVGTPFANLDASNKTNWTGWVAGVGGEWMLSPNILLRVEYLHYDFGDKTLNVSGNLDRHAIGIIPAAAFLKDRDVKASLAADVVRGGVSWKF